MIGLGTLVNTGAIVVGGILGSLVIPEIPGAIQKTTMKAMGLCVTLIGLQMAWTSKNLILVLVSIAVGAVLGELLRIDDRLGAFAARLEHLPFKGRGGLAQGFAQATLMFCVGAMAITGALQDGLSANASTLYAKAVLDGVSSILLGSVLGPGVILAALPVLLYQGAITLGATALTHLLTQPMIVEIGATGGLMVMGIGLCQLGAIELKVANLLPAMVVVAVLVGVIH